MTNSRSSIQLAHDWLVGLRGGEWVLDRLAQQFGPTTIYTLVSDERPLTDAIDRCEVVTSFLQRLPGTSGRLRRWYLPLMPRAVESLRVAPCDVLVSTSSAVMKAIHPPAGAAHVCYCHSPARYIWGQLDEYALGQGGRLRALGLRALRARFQAWDRAASDRVDVFIANSTHTQRKIARYYDRGSIVIHPPVRTMYFTPDPAVEREDWFLVVSALEPYKRVDLAIRAAQRAGVRLRVAGSGSQRAALSREAGSHVEFLGRVDDATLCDLYRRAQALVHPQQEDFGIIAVEAQACGCPVIAYARGGAADTVTPSTGVLIASQRVDAFAEVLSSFGERHIDGQSCRRHATAFSCERFDHSMRVIVEAVLEGERSLDAIERRLSRRRRH